MQTELKLQEIIKKLEDKLAELNKLNLKLAESEEKYNFIVTEYQSLKEETSQIKKSYELKLDK